MPKHYFDRLDRLHELIRRKSTGTPPCLARRLDVSLRTTFDYINILRSLGADIHYCKTRESYYYSEEGTFYFKFIKSNQEHPPAGSGK